MQAAIPPGVTPQVAYFCPVCRQPQARWLNLFGRELTLEAAFVQAGASVDLLKNLETLNFENYGCPACTCSDRDRLYALFYQPLFEALAASQKQVRFLDFGPSSPLRKFLKSFPNVSYRSCDLFIEDVDDFPVNIEDMHLYPDESFDFFHCSHVLEHVADDRKAMRELCRILKPGGTGVAMVPIPVWPGAAFDEDISLTDENLRIRRFLQGNHVRLYTRGIFVRRLKSAGFRIELLGQKYFSSETFHRTGIAPRAVLYVVRK